MNKMFFVVVMVLSLFLVSCSDRTIFIGTTVINGSGSGSNITIAGLSSSDINMSRLSSSTYYTLQDWSDTTQSTGKISGGAFTDNGDGTIDVSAGTGLIRATNSELVNVLFFDWSQKSSLSLVDNSANYILVDYNGGSPVVTTSTTIPSDHNTKILLGEVYREGTDLHEIYAGQVVSNFNGKIFWKSIEVFGKFQRASGIVIGEEADRKISSTAGVIYAGITRTSISAFDSSGVDTFTYYYRDGVGGWTKIVSQTQIDNTHYDDGDGTLGTLSSGGWFGSDKYGVHWVYEDVDSDVFVVYGQGDYTLSEAQDAQPPGSVPDMLNEVGGLIGKIIIQKNDNYFTSTQSTFDIKFSPSSVQNHNELSNLQGGSVDEYYHLNESEYNGNFSDRNITADYFIGDGSQLTNVGGGSVWLVNGNNIYYDDGDVYVNNSDGDLIVTDDITSANFLASNYHSNIFVGDSAGQTKDTSLYSVLCVGSSACNTNSGNTVIGIGSNSASSNTGSNCIGVGSSSLASNSGSYNIGLGDQSLYLNSGSHVIGIGYRAAAGNANNNKLLIADWALSTTPVIEADLSVGGVKIRENIQGRSCSYAKEATFTTERGSVSSNAPLAMGNGQTPTGAPQVCDGKVTTLAAMCSGAASSSNHVAFELRKNGASQTCDTGEITSLNTMYQASSCDVSFSSGDILNCYSKTETGSVKECVCTFWVQYD